MKLKELLEMALDAEPTHALSQQLILLAYELGKNNNRLENSVRDLREYLFYDASNDMQYKMLDLLYVLEFAKLWIKRQRGCIVDESCFVVKK
jgi:hypothetical protein